MSGKKTEIERKGNYDPRQHAMLLYCSYKGDAFFWNDWRNANPREEILLFAANLKGARLYRANLEGAELSSAKLQGAELSAANLQRTLFVRADLQKAHLSRANLEGAMLLLADLRKADFSNSNLQEADLRETNLQDTEFFVTNLHRARLSSANLQKAKISWANLQEADISDSNLHTALFVASDLSKANLRRANLQGVILDADLRNAQLSETNLQGAKLSGANLQGAELSNANLKRASFDLSHVDGMTKITRCIFDKHTDFTGVGLDGATIDPQLKVALKINIRRKEWKAWFERGKWYTKICKKLFVRPFWQITDYGGSTTRIIYIFLALAALYGGLYFAFEAVPGLHSIVHGLRLNNNPDNWHVAWRAIYFSVVTMTTLGFGDIHAAESADLWGFLGCLFLSFQVITGYVLLGALVTRLGILFTSDAPAAKPTRGRAKVKRSDLWKIS